MRGLFPHTRKPQGRRDSLRSYRATRLVDNCAALAGVSSGRELFGTCEDEPGVVAGSEPLHLRFKIPDVDVVDGMIGRSRTKVNVCSLSVHSLAAVYTALYSISVFNYCPASCDFLFPAFARLCLFVRLPR